MNNLNRHFLFHLPIILLAAYGLVYGGVFSSFFGLNTAESIALCTLLIAAFLWVSEWIPLYMTSFVILLMQLLWLAPAIEPVVSKTSRARYLAPFFSEIILLFLGGFVLAAALNKYGLDRRIANWLLKRTGSGPSRVMLGFMVASAFLSMWMSNTATTAMMFAILLPISDSIPKGNPFAKGLALSIPFACNLGGLGTPIGTPPNAIAMTFLAGKGVHVSFISWMAGMVPFMAVFLLVLWLILLKLFPPGDFHLELPEENFGLMTLEQKVVIGVFLFTVTAWFTADFHKVSIGIVSLFPLVTLFGLGLLKNQDFKNLPWDVLFMVGGGICLGVGLAQSGLTDKIVTLIPVQGNFTLVLVVFGLLTAVMTTFMSNTATANLLIPLAVSLDHQIGLLVLTVALNCSTAMSLPVSTPPNAIAFGSGMLESKDMLWAGLSITLVALLAAFIFGSAYWPRVVF